MAKSSAEKFFFLMFAVLIVFCLLASYINEGLSLDANIFLFPFFVVSFVIYSTAVKLDIVKLLYIFVCTMASLSFGGITNNALEARLFSDVSILSKHSTWGLLAQWIICIIALGISYVVNDKLIWMLENFNSRKIWLIALIAPVMMTWCNVAMIPKHNSTMVVGRIWQIWITVEIVFLILYILFRYMFYLIAKFITEKYEVERKAQLTQMQQEQYESMKVYYEKTERLRHDFCHTVRTISELLKNKEYDELENYINDYNNGDIKNSQQFNFCSHIAANAILKYYITTALAEEIDISWEVDIPHDINISNVDLCVVLGNLLENAIQACKDVEPKKRKINLSVDTDTPGELYIVVINSFSGNLEQKNGRFLSTKKDGRGLGLLSVTSVAEKYNGVAEFFNNGDEFVSNVMMVIK